MMTNDMTFKQSAHPHLWRLMVRYGFLNPNLESSHNTCPMFWAFVRAICVISTIIFVSSVWGSGLVVAPMWAYVSYSYGEFIYVDALIGFGLFEYFAIFSGFLFWLVTKFAKPMIEAKKEPGIITKVYRAMRDKTCIHVNFISKEMENGKG